jgi:hypothetical protein
MSFHLIAVGGSGLWAMYHHILKHVAQASARLPENERVPLPQEVTVIDQAGPDVEAILDELSILRLALAPRGINVPTPNRVRLGSARQASGAAPTHIASTEAIGTAPQQNNAASMLAHGCLQFDAELRRDVNIGFFGQPRLTSWWASMFGFEVETPKIGEESRWLSALRAKNFDARRNNRATAGLPIVVVGSIVGGTGAGLMPTLAAELIGDLADADASAWRHDFHAIALFPWFDMGVDFNGPQGTRLKANAARGAQSLLGVYDRVQTKLAGDHANQVLPVTPANGVRTSLTLLGAQLEQIRAQRPLDPRRDGPLSREAMAVAPIFDVVSTAIAHALTAASAAFPKREHLRVNLFAMGTASSEGGKLRIWTPEAEGNVIAAHRALMLCKEDYFPLNAASHFPFLFGKTVHRPGGLGKTMSTILAGSAQAGSDRMDKFVAAYRAELTRLAEATFTRSGRLPAEAQGALSSALEVPEVIRALDTVLTDANLQDRLFIQSDAGRNATLDGQDINEKAVAAAVETWSILTGASTRQDLSPRFLSSTTDETKLITWAPGGVASIQSSKTLAPGSDARVFDYLLSDATNRLAIASTVRSSRNHLAGGLAYDTEGWAELFGHYQAVLADIEEGQNLHALNDATWNGFKAAAKRLYIGVALGSIDVVALTDAEKAIARIGRGQRALDNVFPLKLVLRSQPTHVVGFVLPSFGLCPSPRAVALEQTDPLSAQIEAIPLSGQQVTDAESAIRWFTAELPDQEPAKRVLQMLFGAGTAELPHYGPGLPQFIPGAAFALKTSRHFLPRLRTQTEVSLISRLESVPSQNPTAAASFTVPFEGDGFLLPGFPAGVQAFCNSLPAPAPNSARPLVRKFHNVT